VTFPKVFRFNGAQLFSSKSAEPDLVLGRQFEPGSDDDHFCKPTSVAVEASGEFFYVADGYCNHRVIKYQLDEDENGAPIAIKVWETGTRGVAFADPYALRIPHCLALCENLNLICVADREHGRIQCFDINHGGFMTSLSTRLIGENVYGMDCKEVAGKASERKHVADEAIHAIFFYRP